MKRLAALALAAAAWPAAAHAQATLVARDLVPEGGRSLAAAKAPARFDMVGLHWRGPGGVLFRTRSLTGRWSAWQAAAPEAEDLPDRGAAEARTVRGWRIGNPWWTGGADRLEIRTVGRVTLVRAFYLRSPVSKVPMRAVSIAGSPRIMPRSGWQADERIRRARPLYAPAVRFAVVHHTAGSNSYSPAQSAAIVRAIEVYHVKANGWNDIGYNFLVDRYGQVFEGRYGGIDRAVIGAHAEGFNTGSVGVAVLGTYASGAPSTAAQEAVARLLAWRLDLAHVDPLTKLLYLSGGNPKYSAGTPVPLRVVSGHRDTGFTSCPGTAFYRLLDRIAAKAAALGLPKLYSPKVSGRLGGLVRFTGRLSSALPWTVSVVDAEGGPVASGSGTGAQIDWTWDSSSNPAGRFRWAMDAGPRVRPASGALGSSVSPPPPLGPLLSGLAVSPPVVSPNGDGFADTATVSYTLAARANVTATILDANGVTIATLFSAQAQSARAISFALPVDSLADGRYTLNVFAVTTDGRNATLQAPFAVGRTLSSVAVAPSPWSPAAGALTFTFQLAKPALVRIEIRQNGVPAALVFEGSLPAGPQSLQWPGPLPAGHYQASVAAADGVLTLEQTAEFDVTS